MKFSQFLILIILIIMIFMAVTNPGMDDYVDWVTDQSREEASNRFEELVASFVGETMVRRVTSRDNYVLFSIYETDIPDVNGEESSRVIGIFGNFFVLNSPE